MPARKRGPAPTLRNAKRLTVLVDGKTMRAVDAFARIRSVNRSESARALIATGLQPHAADSENMALLLGRLINLDFSFRDLPVGLDEIVNEAHELLHEEGG
jgi:hypothetical protein